MEAGNHGLNVEPDIGAKWMVQTADIVICGAGCMGIAAAYSLAQRGVGKVVLVDKHLPLSQTSARSGGNYGHGGLSGAMGRVMNRSIDLLERLAGESGNVFHLTQRGVVFATMLFPDCLQEGELCGADMWRDRDLIHGTFPYFANGVAAVVHARRGGDFSPQRLGVYLLQQAKRRGVAELRGEVVGFERDGGGITAVFIQTPTERQTIYTRTFVNAAGPFAPHLNTLLGVNLPMLNIFQQEVAFHDPLGIIPRSAPCTVFTDPQLLPWREDERELLQAEAGYGWLLGEFPGGLQIQVDGGESGSWIRLGWGFNQTAEKPVWKRPLLSEFLDIVLRGASRLVPGLAAYFDNVAKPVAHYGGYYTQTLDNLPLIGPLNVAGAYICGAFAGFGTTASCWAGELLADWVCGTTLPDDAATFAPARMVAVSDDG